MRLLQSVLADAVDPDPTLAVDEFWHGGKIVGSRVRGVLYCSKNKMMAASYVDMAEGRMAYGNSLHLISTHVSKPAPPAEVVEVANSFGSENEEMGYTPASVFDRNLHDQFDIMQVVKELQRRGYDHAALTDVAFGVTIEDEAVVLFDGTPFHIIRTEPVSGPFGQSN